MARRRQNQIETRTKAPTVPKAKYEKAITLARTSAQRTRAAADERMGTLLGMAVGFGVGKYEANGNKLPTAGGLEGTALWGGLLAFGPTLIGAGRSRIGQMAAEAGSSLLGIACYKAGKGLAPMVGGDDGGWE